MNTNELRELLKTITHQELVQLLMAYGEKEPSFIPVFYSFVRESQQGDEEQMAREEVDRVFQLNGSQERSLFSFLDWRYVMKDSHALFEKGRLALGWGDLRRAVAYPLQWFRDFAGEFMDDAFDYDEEGTEYCNACGEAAKLIEEALRHPQADDNFKKEVCDELISIAQENDVYEEYGFIDFDEFAVRMVALTQSPEKAIALADQLMDNGVLGEDWSYLLIKKCQLLMDVGMQDKLLQLVADNSSNDVFCMGLVQSLIADKKYELALKVLDIIIEKRQVYQRLHWINTKLDICEALGYTEQLIAAHRDMFVSTHGDMSSYEALKSLIPAGEWKAFLASMMGEACLSDSYCGAEGNVKANIFVAEQDMDSLFHLLMEEEGEDAFSLLKQYAAKLPDDSQYQLIPKYVSVVEKEASKADSRSKYERVTSHLLALATVKGSRDVVNELIQRFRESYSRRRAFMEELMILERKLSKMAVS